MWQLLLTLSYLEKNGIVHRDLKPSNIMLMHTGMLKLIDFGFSRKIKKNINMTLDVGTDAFLAPELTRSAD